MKSYFNVIEIEKLINWENYHIEITATPDFKVPTIYK